tara:strand:- start:9516 stop:11738 length:2223 start_codon:yes stop_codon:yes gene_type:complete
MDAATNVYERRFAQCLAAGAPPAEACIAVINDYLAGKPVASRGKRKEKTVTQHADFWAGSFLWDLPTEIYESLPFVLALARYLGQETASNTKLLEHIATMAPAAVYRSVRYSGIVLRQDSQRWTEIKKLATAIGSPFSELALICKVFRQARREREAELDAYRAVLTELSPLELLTYASLFAFEHLLPEAVSQRPDNDMQESWYAINDILIWKLGQCSDVSFCLTEAALGASLRDHLSPFLFPSPQGSKIRDDLYQAFVCLVDAQIEMNSFLSRSVDAFCYDDAIRFELSGSDLIIVEHDPDAREVWKHNGDKLARLHQYWFYRAVDEFVQSGKATEQIGRLENHEQNQLAYIKAIRTKLRLTEVYGLGDAVVTETGLQVDLFQALLSLELMAIFYDNDFVRPFNDNLNNTGNWCQALSQLAMGGLRQGLQNRFPITWSDRKEKIESIRPWTVNETFPDGNVKAAEAILDFWTNDLRALSGQLRQPGAALTPELFEQPILKIGRYLFQLPWMAALQNNSTAAINTLRRIGARRAEAGGETQRIEHRLAQCFKDRGFNVCLNYHPDRMLNDDPGEIDLICFRDGQLLVLEVKSTFIRSTKKEAWLHKTATLRRAGLQLHRKVVAIEATLENDRRLVSVLGINKGSGIIETRGWIVDTSIEHDHERFSGFLKVSLEEVLIALRDDSHLLNDQEGWFNERSGEVAPERAGDEGTMTLYPNGFSGADFVDVIEQQRVWANTAPIN